MEPIENLLKTTLAEVERLLNTRTVVGDPITVEGNTIIPLVAVGFGFGGGGGSGKGQKTGNLEGLGGGSGGGGGVKPVAVVIINKDGVRVEPVRRGAATMIEKVGEAVGKIIDKRAEKKT
jgi:sporulation protein YtfJ